MIDFLIILIGIVVLLFFETLFMSLGLFSILLVFVLLTYGNVTLWKLLAILVPVSIALDVSNHMFIGSTLLVLVLVTTIFQVMKRYLPFERLEIRGLILLLTSFIFYVLYFIAISISDDQNIGNYIDLDSIKLALRMGIAGTIIYLLVEAVISSWSGRGNGISIGNKR